jgi:hypothetical protein
MRKALAAVTFEPGRVADAGDDGSAVVGAKAAVVPGVEAGDRLGRR